MLVVCPIYLIWLAYIVLIPFLQPNEGFVEFVIGIIVIVVLLIWWTRKSRRNADAGSSLADVDLNGLLQRGKSLIAVGDELPSGINFMRNEQPMIAIDNVDFIRTKMEWISGNAGVSFRVAKGVTLRGGRSKGQRIETPHVLDTGTLVATTRCFYFIGERNTAKYLYEKLMLCRLNDAGDTIELTKNTANAKTEYFEHNGYGLSKMTGAYYVYERFTMDPDAGEMKYSDDISDAIVIDTGTDST